MDGNLQGRMANDAWRITTDEAQPEPRRPSTIHHPPSAFSLGLTLAWGLALNLGLLVLVPPAFAAAPMSGPIGRRTVPYAEAKCADPDVFFCEDFEDAGTAPTANGVRGSCDGLGRWKNPGWASSDYCWNAPTSRVTTPALPIPGFTNNTVYQMSSAQGTIDGRLKDGTRGTAYTDYYIRWQFYYSPDMEWPTELDAKQMLAHPEVFLDPPSADFQNGIFFTQDFYCSGVHFPDVPMFRYRRIGDAFPLYNEYCPPLAPGQPANNVNAPRIQLNRWYTVEVHFVHGPDSSTGLMEAWLDGHLMYRVNRATCVACPPMSYVYWTAYKGDPLPHPGYIQYDNLVMSTRYIGPPATIPDPEPPTIPQNLTATVVSQSQINLTWTAATDNVGVARYRLTRNGSVLAAMPTGTSYTDTGLTPSSLYTYTVAAVDAAGNVSGESLAASAMTLAPDTQAPTVSLTAPLPGATLLGTVSLSATASDDRGVVGVQFRLDGAPPGC